MVRDPMASEKPLVVLLHGFPDTPLTWRALAEALRDQGHEVITPWLPGLDPEGTHDVETTAAGLAAETARLLQKVHADRAILVGHDWGVIGACGGAILAPERVLGVVAMAVPHGGALGKALMSDPEQQRLSWYMYFFQLPFAVRAVEMNRCAFLHRLWKDWSPDWDAPEEMREAVIRCYGRPGMLERALGYYRSTFQVPPEHRTPEALELKARLTGTVPVPTLYIHGEADRCILPRVSEGMESLFPAGLTRHIIKGAGHFVHLERPEIVRDLVLRFIATVSRPS